VFERAKTVHASDRAASLIGRQIIIVQDKNKMLHLGCILTITDSAMTYHFEIVADKFNLIGIGYVHICGYLYYIVKTHCIHCNEFYEK
jgi:hypothetical protein